MNGKLITFEGIDGSGKTTQANHLCRFLRDKEIGVFSSYEPYPVDASELIGKGLGIYYKKKEIRPLSITLLYFVLRYEHVLRLIKPYLERGTWVICDRFIDSTVAYQGYGQGVDRRLIEDLSSYVESKVDLTFVMDVPVEVSLGRVGGRMVKDGDFNDVQDDDFCTRVRDGFLSICREDTNRCVRIDGTKDVEVVSKEISDKVSEKFSV